MCFFKTEKSKVLVAKRNIKVYKIGIYADNDSFNPFFYQAFEYRVNQIVFTKVKFQMGKFCILTISIFLMVWNGLEIFIMMKIGML